MAGKKRAAARKRLPDGIIQRGSMYYANKQIRGKRLRGRLASDLDVAKELLAELVAKEYRRGVLPTSNDYPWKLLVNEHVRAIRQESEEHARLVEMRLNRFEELTGVTNASDVTRDVVTEYRENRRSQILKGKTRGPAVATINDEVGVVSAMLRRAVDDKKIAYNPIAGIKRIKVVQLAKVRRSLEPDEVAKLLAASPLRLRRTWWMLLNTGMRLGELTTLRFSDIDFKDKSIRIRREVNKSRRARTVPVSDDTIKILRELRDEAAARQPYRGRNMAEHCARRFTRDIVFVTSRNTPWGNSLLDSFKRCARRAEIQGSESGGSVDLHSLRVTHITTAIDNGADIKAVSENVGHHKPGITLNVYKKSNANRRREAVNVLPFRMPGEMTHR